MNDVHYIEKTLTPIVIGGLYPIGFRSMPKTGILNEDKKTYVIVAIDDNYRFALKVTSSKRVSTKKELKYAYVQELSEKKRRKEIVTHVWSILLGCLTPINGRRPDVNIVYKGQVFESFDHYVRARGIGRGTAKKWLNDTAVSVKRPPKQSEKKNADISI